MLLNYHNETSWSTQYNLFADVLLGLDFVPQSVYAMLADYYPAMMRTSTSFFLPSVNLNITDLSTTEEYGLPLDSRLDHGKSDWQVFAAAAFNTHRTEPTRDLMLNRVMRYVKSTPFDGPLTDFYETRTARWHGFRSR